MAVIVPEVVLLNVLESLLKRVKLDYEQNQQNSTPDKSLLHCYFEGLKHYKKDYYKEAVDLFTREKEHARYIEARLFFDAKRSKAPTIHITMPSDQSGQNSIGIGESGFEEDVKYFEDNTFRSQYERRFDSQYHIVCTSDNHSEVLLMYHLIRAALISILDTLQLAGLENPKLSGQELKINPDLVPNHIFMRSITLATSYDVQVPVWWDKALINEICVGDVKILND